MRLKPYVHYCVDEETGSKCSTEVLPYAYELSATCHHCKKEMLTTKELLTYMYSEFYYGNVL